MAIIKDSSFRLAGPITTNAFTYNTTNNLFRIKSYTEGVLDLGLIGTDINPIALDVTANTNFKCVLGGNTTTFAFTNVQRNSQLPTVDTVVTITIFAKQDATGGRQITWPANVIWDNGSQPQPTNTANSTAVYMFTTYNGGAPDEVWLGANAIKGAKPE